MKSGEENAKSVQRLLKTVYYTIQNVGKYNNKSIRKNKEKQKEDNKSVQSMCIIFQS
jgi:hypothetical protein